MPLVITWFVCFFVTTSQKDEAIVNALKIKSISPSRLVRTTYQRIENKKGSVLVPGFLWVPPAPGPRFVCSPEGFAPNLLIPGIY